MKRIGILISVALGSMALASCSSTSHQTLAVQVDTASASTFNLEATAYFPDKLTVHPGDTVAFHSNFRGEPHTVTFGAMINRGLAALDKLTPQQQQLLREPPPEARKRSDCRSLSMRCLRAGAGLNASRARHHLFIMAFMH